MVGARIGHRFVGWPFGRLDISDDALVLRSWPALGSSPRSAQKPTVMKVSVNRSLQRVLLTIEDSGGVFENIKVEVPYKIEQLMAELRNRGYFVIDQR